MALVETLLEPKAEMLDCLALLLERGESLDRALPRAFAHAGLDSTEACVLIARGGLWPSEVLAGEFPGMVLARLAEYEQLGEVIGGLRYAAAIQRATARTHFS